MISSHAALKLCCYCHNKPRRANSAYCCDAHADAKHRQNNSDPEKRRRQMRASRAKRREMDRLEHEQELQHQREILAEALQVLREVDNTPHRLTPVQKVRVWNVITNEIKIVQL